MPAIAIYTFRRAAFEHLGVQDNDIIAYSAPATPKLEAITANSTTPYITAFTDLQKGPVVLEIPAAGEDGSVYGQVVDAWQFTIADVGPAGLDEGRGGKLLFTPPDYAGVVPEGYLNVASPNYRIALAFRSVPAAGKAASDAYQYPFWRYPCASLPCRPLSCSSPPHSPPADAQAPHRRLWRTHRLRPNPRLARSPPRPRR